MKGRLGGFQRPQKEHREGAFGYQLAFGRFDIHVAYCSGAAFVRGMRAYGQNLRLYGSDEVRGAADSHIVHSVCVRRHACSSLKHAVDESSEDGSMVVALVLGHVDSIYDASGIGAYDGHRLAEILLRRNVVHKVFDQLWGEFCHGVLLDRGVFR